MNPWFPPSEPNPPVSPGAVVRELQGDGWRVRLDLSPQVLSLDIPETEVASSLREAAVSPVCPRTGLVSASMLAVKAKLFDDGLYAAAELASQPEKARLLSHDRTKEIWAPGSSGCGRFPTGSRSRTRR